jgi:UDP-3-O-[3-hydroxymyristoyl] glucosamine N-acyltransferase
LFSSKVYKKQVAFYSNIFIIFYIHLKIKLFSSMGFQISLGHLSLALEGRLVGQEPEKMIQGIKTLEQAGPLDITFFHNPLYKDALKQTQAGACILQEAYLEFLPSGTDALVCEKPYEAFGKAILLLMPQSDDDLPHTPEIHPTAYIHPSVKLHGGVRIGPYSVLEEGVEIGNQTIIGAFTHIKKGVFIGEQCCLGSHITLQKSWLGKGVRIKDGARIGQEGFGFSMEDPLSRKKIPQIGRVVLEDHVDIGSNTTIDRGSLEDTRIGSYSKIDNLVQIAHNVVLGKFCVIAAQTGISGSTKIGDYVMMGGQTGVSGHLKIGNYTQIAAKSGVMRSTKVGAKIAGIPAMDAPLWRRTCVLLKRWSEKKSSSMPT